MIEFDRLEYTYPCSRHPAIKNLSWQIPVGRRCALIGRNGCGKTTLLRLANGLYQPQKGVIRFQGKPLQYNRAALSHLRQNVGLVFQNPEQQLVATTVSEDIAYGLGNLGVSEKEMRDRVRSTLADFELEDLAHTPINYLSLGQKKRVSIADVMVLSPQLLLLDEPTAYLDPYQVRQLRRMLNQIEAKGTTIAIATHNLDFVYAWANWVCVVDRGQIVAEGTPERIFRQSEVVKDLGLGRPLIVSLLDALSQGKHTATDLQSLQQSLMQITFQED
ncbi:MAG: ABC transporter ATP-binding protein [Jaaginema sp. PMC 1079.18]|nr:ABC transporter ATP-binding protein [Jaaginema sp. PMC 1080.18]MEC4852547.1 ABC transporter ATP-binding protein [Jaaginema sp. PMC 1079.18]MEC4867958.1 ABC transporter ATP-binding protein [Jaaginema sp. PMC 1078.18]